MSWGQGTPARGSLIPLQKGGGLELAACVNQHGHPGTQGSLQGAMLANHTCHTGSHIP